MENASPYNPNEGTIYAEFEDPRRMQLIQAIVALSPELAKLPRDTYFCLWLADISRLEVLADPKIDKTLRYNSIMNLIPDPCLIGARAFELKGPRDQQVAKASLEIDNNICILTQTGQPGLVPARIFPYSLNGSDGAKTWRFLSMLWTEEKVSAWKESILEFSPDRQSLINTEKVENYITLHIGPHNLWNRCGFALRPIFLDANQTHLRLQFHYLPLKSNVPKTFRSELVDTASKPDLPSLEELDYCPSQPLKLFCFDGEDLMSGEDIAMWSSDPKKYPLPSWHLLEMQWIFSRISAMYGASDPQDEANEC
ncbi:hypothetical protein N7457_005309 [Penicillium paradoxum]|uniref:uncharacterized protein n=1 Tax=Penicillium paradoxum TaxID=176176 RepID=UPI002549450A|nr:uncharacterized protein N7457_005309 [Penicillium paradoxum]KAJ5780149.1 hypothetical protein N7457_005309 [Penicillium paradoxum]